MSVEKIFIIFIKRGVRLYNNAPSPQGWKIKIKTDLLYWGKIKTMENKLQPNVP